MKFFELTISALTLSLAIVACGSKKESNSNETNRQNMNLNSTSSCLVKVGAMETCVEVVKGNLTTEEVCTIQSTPNDADLVSTDFSNKGCKEKNFKYYCEAHMDGTDKEFKNKDGKVFIGDLRMFLNSKEMFEDCPSGIKEVR